ncbi:ATPSCKMT [Symbiodinium sp. KB8]|nr:ATPSCKMT [Symbiodinium sp. KB8]
MLCYIILCYIIFWVLQAGRLCFASKSQRLTEDGSISLVSLLRWYTGSNGSEHKAASYSFSAATLLTGLLGSGVVGCDAGAGLAVMGYRRIYSQLRELKEEKMVTMIMEKESQSGLLETMPEYYKLLAKEFEGDMELLFELFCEVDESNNLMLEEREVEIMLRKMDTGATPEDLRRYVAEINLALLGMHEDFCFGCLMAEGSSEASMPDGLPEEVKKKRINVLGFEVAVAESKIRKVFLGATGFFIIFNSLTLPFALPKLRRFLGAPYVPMKRNAVEVPSTSTFSGLMDRAAAVLDAASLAEVLTNTAAGRLRCCSRLLRFVGREPGGRFLCAALHEDADRLRPLLKGSFVWWERLVTLDLAKTLEMGGSGLKRGLCRSLAEDGTMWIVEDELAAMLPPVYQQLKALRRMSLAVSYEDMRGEGSKLSAPNCLQEVGSLPAMQELYIATDHCCLEVALLGALAQLGNLRKLWLHLGSLQYNEAVSGALVARLPCKFLEVLSLWGTARLLRDVLSALGPQGSRSMPQLKELDLSMHREAPGGRITDARHGPGEVPSDAVWAVLERGAPGLEHFCLCGALAWYPPISDAWFSTLLQALRGGHGSALRSLDIRQNRIRADVAERLSDRLHSLRSKDFDLLWDGMGGSGTAQVVLFGQVLPAWAARRGGTSSKAGPLAGLRLVDFGSGDGRLVAAAAKRGMHATGYELNPYLVLWSRLRCFRALRTGPGSGQLRWANVWSADLRDADVVTVYGRPGDSFMEHAAKKLDEELPSNAAVVSHFFDVPGWERRLVQDVDGLKLYDFSLRGDDHRSADGPLSFASLIDWWDQARTVPNSLVSEKGSALVASIKGRSYAATVAGLFGDTAVQRRWDQADAEGTLQALRQAYCRTWREVREYKAERDLRKAETECWKEEFFPVSAMSDPFHPMVRIAVTAIDMALDLLAARSLLDAACGDAAWMVAAVLSRRSVQYTGVDIVQHVTEENQRSFPSHRFIAADCSSNAELPQADVVFSKETLNHMFVEDAVQALKCFRRSSRYLVTNIHRGAPNNLGASKGHHAHYVPYDFSLPPFNLRKLCQLVPINHEDWTEFALFAL